MSKVKEVTIGASMSIQIIKYELSIKPSASVTIEIDEDDDVEEVTKNVLARLRHALMKSAEVELQVADDFAKVMERTNNDIDAISEWVADEVVSGMKVKDTLHKKVKKTVRTRKKKA